MRDESEEVRRETTRRERDKESKKTMHKVENRK